jgi:hypothetical protein
MALQSHFAMFVLAGKEFEGTIISDPLKEWAHMLITMSLYSHVSSQSGSALHRTLTWRAGHPPASGCVGDFT